MALTNYGDISPRTGVYAIVQMLKRALPNLILERFGQTYVLPNNKSKVASFRRYEALAVATTALTEGVTPIGSSLTYTDYTATLAQYGDFIVLPDVVLDTHEDPVLNQAVGILGEQAAQTVETIRFNVLKAGTNVFYANKVGARGSVVSTITLSDQRRVTRAFQRQNAGMINRILKSTPNFNTESTEPGYIGLIHPDLANDIRALVGFINVKDYGVNMIPIPGEIGAVEDVRYIRSTIFSSFADAGGAKGTMVSTSDTSADVYPILYIAKDAYGIVPLKGQSSLTPMVINPKATDSDPLAQRGYASWKTMQTAVILNEAWMARLEVGATDL